MRSARTGANASMPSTVTPSAILRRTSAREGCSSARARARSRTVSVSSSSRQGGANSPEAAPPRGSWFSPSGLMERWSATWK